MPLFDPALPTADAPTIKWGKLYGAAPALAIAEAAAKAAGPLIVITQNSRDAEALSEEARPGATRKRSGKETALLIATPCSSPPEGRRRWTLDLLAGAMGRLTELKGCRVRRCADASPRTI